MNKQINKQINQSISEMLLTLAKIGSRLLPAHWQLAASRDRSRTPW